MFSFQMFEFLILNSFSSHCDNFFDKGVLGDEESALMMSENLSDLLNLVRTDISKVDENYLLVLSKKGI